MGRRFAFVPLILALTSACGGVVTGDDAADAMIDGGGADSTGWTQCTSPSNYAVCGGTDNCNPIDCDCDLAQDPNGLGVCFSATYATASSGQFCRPGFDGRACLFVYPKEDAWADIAFDVAVLFAENGGASRVRYADLSLWTDAGLPNAPSCPDLGNVTACGGGCGACPSSQTCVGRSPLHPVGICIHTNGCGLGTDAGLGPLPCDYMTESCFIYLVQPEAQVDADNAGICLPKADCDALSESLPGGGKCYGGP
jgi:hypothetical protein